MPALYSKYYTKTLQAAIDEQLNRSPSEQLALFEELALVRESCGDAIKLWSALRDMTVPPDITDSAERKKRETELQSSRQIAGQLMVEALTQVTRIAQQAAIIEASGKDKYSIHTLKHFVQQIVGIAYETFEPDNRKLAEQFEAALHAKLKLPVSDAQGTTLTPDQDAIDMDQTVPRAPRDTGLTEEQERAFLLAAKQK